MTPEFCLSLLTLHGTIAVFFVLTLARSMRSGTSCCRNNWERRTWRSRD